MFFFANWKMYLDGDESVALAQKISELSIPEQISITVFPNELAFYEVQKIFQNTSINLGAQNIAWTPKGAYTGATSGLLFQRAGATYALVGHSERRHIFGESDEDVRKKVEACFDIGLIPVLCIGETKQDLDEGKRQYRLKKQLFSALDGVSLEGKKMVLAYEPVWAIGTGTPCTPADVADVHEWITQEIHTYSHQSIPILYGGSVDTTNLTSYTSLSCVDGVLVGSASTKFESVRALVQSFSQCSHI